MINRYKDILVTLLAFVITFLMITITKPTTFTKIKDEKRSLNLEKTFLVSAVTAFFIYVGLYLYKIQAKGNFSFNY